MSACAPAGGAPEAQGEDTGATTAALLSGVSFKTVLGGRYVGAQNNGGSTVLATATSIQAWEKLTLDDANGGTLQSGDTVYILAGTGQYFQAANGGGSTLNAASTNRQGWEQFRIVKKSGTGTIVNGDVVGLQTVTTGNWVSAENGGGGTVYAYGGSLGDWESLTISGLSTTTPPPSGTRTRVIGYVPNWYGSYASWVGKLDFTKLTHVNLAFALADTNGKLQLAAASDLATFVNAAHAKGVKVFPSLCGGGGDGKITPYYQPGKVDAFVDEIINFTVSNNMDGIDVDVEAPDRMGATYDTFIAKLIAKARPRGLPVTAAVAQWMQYGMSDTTLRSFDFINVMSYDNTGTWTGAGDHSSYNQAVDALNYYVGKGVAREKLVLGVPFYGYCWGNCGNGQTSAYILYKDILAKYPTASGADWINANGAQYSYNGLATLRSKTTLAKGYGGIMIWEMAGDVASSSSQSLLSAIDGSAR